MLLELSRWLHGMEHVGFLARFFAMGHTPGRQVVAPPARTREFPYTLDLRA